MEKRYHGSCHCGSVAFEADADLAKGTSRCNCSICRKTRRWGVLANPSTFRVTRGEALLGRYSFSEGGLEHCFCSRCGVQLFSRGHVPELGGAFVSLSVAVLDDADEEELVAAPIRWCDGLHDNWSNPPEEIRHL